MSQRTKMRAIWVILIYLRYVCSQRYINYYAADIEKEHEPDRYTSTRSPFLFGTNERVPYYYESPDFRVEEPLYHAYRQKDHLEVNRPYRLTPHYKVTYRWRYDEQMNYAGCYCTTVYRRLTLLAGCAVITTRHLLTTATSTHLIMRSRYKDKNVEGILGAWYDTNHNNYNSSYYITPARIHYHPLIFVQVCSHLQWHYPEDVNRSHPFSFTFDLAVWTTAHRVYGYYLNSASTYVCLRATSHSREQAPPTPSTELFVIVGYQFMYAYRRKPMPWYKYGIRTKDSINPCPKAEWGWFICLYGNHLRYGIESGTLLHRTFKGYSWRYDGLIGLGAFTMKLRSVQLTHYFTILDNHKVLDFLYDAYRQNVKAVWKDKRFIHNPPYAPYNVKPIPVYYITGHQNKIHPYYD